MAIVFFKSGRWSGTNAAVEALLTREFPDDRLVVVDVWAELRRRPLLLGWLALVGLVRLRPSIHLGRGEWGFFFYSRTARNVIRRLARREAHRALDGERPRFTFQAPARFLAGFSGVPRFCYVDTTESLKPMGPTGRRTPVERAVLALETELFGVCARSFAHSERVTEAIVRDYGVAPERAVTAYGGTNLVREDVPRAAPTGSPRILFVAVEWERKGGDVLVEAYRSLRPRFPGVELHIVGVEVDAPPPGCVVHGAQPREEVARQLAAATVFCLPARRDFFPNVIREALLFGVPVVTTTAAGLPDVLRDGESCLLVDPEDPAGLAAALTRLLENPAAAQQIGEAGRQVSHAHFTWEAVGRVMRHEIVSQLP